MLQYICNLLKLKRKYEMDTECWNTYKIINKYIFKHNYENIRQLRLIMKNDNK